MSNVSDRLSAEQLAALNDNPQYQAAVLALANNSKVISELHQMMPDEIELLVDEMLTEVEKSYGHIDLGACEGIITSYVVTWFAHQKKEFIDDPVPKLLEVLQNVLTLRASIQGFTAVLATI